MYVFKAFTAEAAVRETDVTGMENEGNCRLCACAVLC